MHVYRYIYQTVEFLWYSAYISIFKYTILDVKMPTVDPLGLTIGGHFLENQVPSESNTTRTTDPLLICWSPDAHHAGLTTYCICSLQTWSSMSSWKQQHQIIYPAKFPAKNPDKMMLTGTIQLQFTLQRQTAAEPCNGALNLRGEVLNFCWVGGGGKPSPHPTQVFSVFAPKISFKQGARSWLNELTLWTFEGQIIVFYELSSDMVKFGQGSPTQILRLYILLQVLSHWKKGQTQTSG